MAIRGTPGAVATLVNQSGTFADIVTLTGLWQVLSVFPGCAEQATILLIADRGTTVTGSDVSFDGVYLEYNE